MGVRVLGFWVLGVGSKLPGRGLEATVGFWV